MEENDSYQFNVDLNNFKGPLDLLLDLAKSQKVDLEKISVTKLADQFHNFITKAKKLNLELASEYLLMATWLTYLKSKLLLPESEEEEFLEELKDILAHEFWRKIMRRVNGSIFYNLDEEYIWSLIDRYFICPK